MAESGAQLFKSPRIFDCSWLFALYSTIPAHSMAPFHFSVHSYEACACCPRFDLSWHLAFFLFRSITFLCATLRNGYPSRLAAARYRCPVMWRFSSRLQTATEFSWSTWAGRGVFDRPELICFRPRLKLPLLYKGEIKPEDGRGGSQTTLTYNLTYLLSPKMFCWRFGFGTRVGRFSFVVRYRSVVSPLSKPCTMFIGKDSCGVLRWFFRCFVSRVSRRPDGIRYEMTSLRSVFSVEKTQHFGGNLAERHYLDDSGLVDGTY